MQKGIVFRMGKKDLLQKYLERTERLLRPLPASERQDILREIHSTIAEMQADGVLETEIYARLGSPKQLAREYLGACMQDHTMPWATRLLAAMAFYSAVGITGIFVLPVLTVLAAGMLLSAAIAPIAGLVKFIGFVFGFDVPYVMMQFGDYTMHPALVLPVSFAMGAAFLGAAYGLWRLLRRYVRAVSRGKFMLHAAKAG